MSNTALLIVDVQNDFCLGGALAIPKGDEVVAPLNAIITHAEKNGWLIVASRDWHPPYTKHFKAWPPHGIQYSWGAEFHPDLKLCHYIFSKGTKPDEDGYSAFDGMFTIFDCNVNPIITPFSLLEFMPSDEYAELYIGGLATDYCVKMPALDAIRHGFKTTILIDACRAVNVNPNDEDEAISEMQKAGVIISTTHEVLKINP